jgi:hypothetical protein
LYSPCIKAYERVTVLTPLIRNFGTSWVVSLALRPL